MECYDVDVPIEFDSEEGDKLSTCSEESTEQEYWDSDIEMAMGDFDNDDRDDEVEEDKTLNKLLFVMIVFIFLWASFYGVSAVAVNHLLQYLHHMLASLAVHSPAVGAVVAAFPSSLYLMKKLFGIGTDKFQKYVICRKCESLYRSDDCFEYNLFRKISKTCSHIAFPDHPHASRRIQCGHKLVKEVITKKGKNYCPMKMYCYLPIVKSLDRFGRIFKLIKVDHF